MASMALGFLRDVGLDNDLPALVSEYWKPTLAICLALTPIVNYTYMSVRTHYQLRDEKEGRAPPELPYFIPGLGHLLSVIIDSNKFLNKTIDKYGIGVPVAVRVGPWTFYVLSNPEVFMGITKTSLHLTPKPTTSMAMANIFGMAEKSVKVWRKDDSGISPNPLPESKVPHDYRVWYHESSNARKWLSGNSLRTIGQNFVDNITNSVAEDDRVGYEWVDVPDFYNFTKEIIFEAAISAIFGPAVLKLNPTFTKDFWEYNGALTTLLMGFPRWMAPKSWAARDRVLKGIKKWHKYAREQSDPKDVIPEGWSEAWGSDYMKARQNFRSKVAEVDDDAHAANDLALMVAANSNAMMASAWFLLESIRDPELMPRLLGEFRAGQAPDSTAECPKFDIEKLTSQPLLQSIYAEVLRLRIGLMLNRTSQFHDVHIGPYKFPPYKPIGISAIHCGSEKRLWNDLNGQKPLDKFWADRFMVFPGDKTSGPWSPERRDQLQSGHDKDSFDIDAIDKPTFSYQGMTGAWIPYGAGEHMCPGRFLAKQEIIGGSAIFMSAYEVELKVPEGWVPEPDMGYLGTGAIPPLDRVACRIRRRRI